jgi:hypothetical protein
MFRMGLFGLVVIAGSAAVFPDRAEAQYSVYIFNHNRPELGWQRSKRDRSINESLEACRKDIASRRLQNKKSGRDYESFGIAAGYRPSIDQPLHLVYTSPRSTKVARTSAGSPAKAPTKLPAGLAVGPAWSVPPADPRWNLAPAPDPTRAAAR